MELSRPTVSGRTAWGNRTVSRTGRTGIGPFCSSGSSSFGLITLTKSLAMNVSVLISNFSHWMYEQPPKSQLTLPSPVSSRPFDLLGCRPFAFWRSFWSSALKRIALNTKAGIPGVPVFICTGLRGDIAAQFLHHAAMACQLDESRIDLACGIEAQVDKEDIL